MAQIIWCQKDGKGLNHNVKKILVIGHFDWTGNSASGAVVKVRNLYDELKKHNEIISKISTVDIFNWKNKKIVTLITIIFKMLFYSEIILVISDSSSKITKIFNFYYRVFKKRFYYVVVGASLGNTLSNNKKRIKYLKFVKSFFVETKECLNSLNKIGFGNVFLMKNFKNIVPLSFSKNFTKKDNYCFCTLSRVNEKKGIIHAIEAISNINFAFPTIKCSLDIYGPVDPDFKEKFEISLSQHQDSHYCGVVNANDTVEVLKKYDSLLFPTLYFDEGIPGTVVDGFAAALPIVCSDWSMRSNIIENDYNGVVYEFGDLNSLVNSIARLVNSPELMTKISKNSLDSFKEYEPSVAIQPLLKSISGDK